MAPRSRKRGKKRGGNRQIVVVEPQQATRRARQRVAQMKAGLDAAAAQWARLLSDPCNAPLVHPIYPGADGGALIRVEAEYTWFAGAGETSGCLFWLPGHPGTDSMRGFGAVNSATATGAIDVSPQAPGYTWLRANSTNARCVAACMQVFWPGTELNRGGFVAGGNLAGGVFTDILGGTAVLSADMVRTMVPNRSRVPEGCFEVRWVPSAGDFQWVDPSESTTVGGNINSKSALCLSASGLPAATGLRVRQVAVYEYTPKYNLGVVTPFNSRAKSRNSLDDVINYLDRSVPNWRARVMAIGLNAAYQFMTRPRGGQARIEL